MNADTQRVQAVTNKIGPGRYASFTYGPNGLNPTGEFDFTKVGNEWQVSHFDFTALTPPRRFPPQKTLKEAHRLAERRVRELPTNVARRREAALEGARPISG